ncbi:MAG: acetolactate synthase large subunit [Candidatus Dadabacteria bacterium]|nr:MAG: acetolactate synthase large subunit [Candidatus Dadabacteria bacterium]
MKAAQLLVRCLENEGVDLVFGLPGEENLDVMDALLDSSIRFVTTRHEQGAAFMADVYGRLTGRAGVCLSTLGPGATNLVTGVADANMDGAPLVAIAGQAATTRLHKESHQVLDLAGLFAPITKYATSILEPEITPEIVRKAFKVAQTEKPGATFIELPENVAAAEAGDKVPLRVQQPKAPAPPAGKIAQAAKLISEARFPIVLAGSGVVRAEASAELVAMAERLGIPVATTFMAKGVIPFSHELSLGAVGLQSKDYVSCGFDRADVIVAVGYDLVEYHPHLWHPSKDRKIVHVDTRPAEVDEHYIVAVGVVGDIAIALAELGRTASRSERVRAEGLRKAVVEEVERGCDDKGFPLKPQRIIADLRRALAPEDIVVCDVGAHKMWMARMYPAERPNTCVISNGFAAMGIAVPGAIAAKLAYPNRRVVAVTGDAGFLMNSQEIETAVRENVPVVVLIWNDGGYGLIEWKQQLAYGRTSHVRFNNPDFVAYARSFGACGERIERADELLPALGRALDRPGVTLIDCPVDYSENVRLTERLGQLVCPI